MLALPGGNPAPLVTLAWALHRDGMRVEAVHAVLYASARRWLHEELLGGALPLEQLRAALADPTLAPVVEHPALRADGTLVEEDALADDGDTYRETAWRVARQLQADPTPLVFALVSGRRRSLVADLVVAFQLLARPQDRLVELRLSPHEAIEPASGFYFPGQATPARVQRYDWPAPAGATGIEAGPGRLLMPAHVAVGAPPPAAAVYTERRGPRIGPRRVKKLLGAARPPLTPCRK